MSGYLLLCPGQGTQHPAMLDFALSTAAGREAIAAASDAAGTDIARRVKAGDALYEPVFAQVSIVATSVASWMALQDELPLPSLVAGYSVGEVAAWCCAGSWTMKEAITLVAERARLMVAATPPGIAMVAVTGVGEAALQSAMGARGHVAIEVDADHWVLAGPREALEVAGKGIDAAGGLLHWLPVGVPSHTPMLATAAEALRAVLAKTRGREPFAPVLRGIDGRTLLAYADSRDAIADAVCQPIRWRSCMEEAAERGIATVLELPPGASLTKMFRARPSVEARAVADFRSVEGVARWLERAN